MRTIAYLSSLALIHTATATSHGYLPYSDLFFGQPNDALLVKRQSCASGYSSCSGLGASNACCPPGTNCQLDQAGHVACCPSHASCTGTIAGTVTGTSTATGTTTSTSNNGGIIIGGTTTTTSTSTTSTTSSQTTTSGVAGGGSTVPNAAYPFVYIPTSYANAALCSSAYTNCQSQSTACFSSLAGVNGVTVSGFGGGITVQGSTGTVLSSASSVCSSLSQSACYGLQQSQCSTITGTNTASTVVQKAGARPRQTACPGLVYAAGAGAAVVGVFV